MMLFYILLELLLRELFWLEEALLLFVQLREGDSVNSLSTVLHSASEEHLSPASLEGLHMRIVPSSLAEASMLGSLGFQ